MTKFKILTTQEEILVRDKYWQNPIFLNKKNDFTTPDIEDENTIERFRNTKGFIEVKDKPKPK